MTYTGDNLEKLTLIDGKRKRPKIIYKLWAIYRI